jgi:prepilin-type N-terminal cleavage/methylation domain-containing protein
MKKRKGFTLIELMIVIAIIIILAAIAIPNYLRMTDRARRSRVAGDFASIATALEAYSVDWGKYPVQIVLEPFGKNDVGSHTEKEIAGTGVDPAEQNVATNKTLTGEDGGIDYIKLATILSMYDPFYPNDSYQYGSADGSKWVLTAQYDTTDYLYRTDATTDLTQIVGAPAVP